MQFAQGLADALPELGVMLPQTPLHHLLLHDFCAVSGRDMLVMTSGNVHNNPLVITDEEALRELGGIADAFVSNNRDIRVRIDDSVVRVLSFTHVTPSECEPVASIADEREEAASLPTAEEETASRASTAPVPEPEPAQSAYSPAQTTTAVQFIRRARGYAPLPLSLKHEHHANETLLALGAEQKNTITLVSGTRAFVSQHIGDVENAATYDSWLAASSRYEQLFSMHPTAFACDKHPEYLPSKWARDEHRASQLPLVEVQHHHAHIASVLENTTSRKRCAASRTTARATAPMVAFGAAKFWWQRSKLSSVLPTSRTFRCLVAPRPFANRFVVLMACYGHLTYLNIQQPSASCKRWVRNRAFVQK